MKNNFDAWRAASALLLLGFLLLSGSLMVSCQQPPDALDEPSVLVASVRQTDGWVRNFNPLSTRGDQLWPARGGIYEPLLIYNVMTSDFEPWLATAYSWHETDRAVTFQLRPGVRWSDGEPFGAQDVAFTFELLHRHPQVDRDNVWSFLREVVVDGDLEISFLFDHTAVPGLEHLAHQPVLPEHVWRAVVDPVGYLNPDPVATGPFTEVLRFDESVYELGRNPHYWKGAEPSIDVLRMPALRNNEEAVAAIRSGSVDWAGNFVPEVGASFLDADPQHRISWSPLIDGPIFLLLNTTKPPFDDARVRKALSLAIDRDLLNERAMHGTSRPADATCLDDAKKSLASQEALARGTWTSHDPKAAEALLDEAGYPRGGSGLRGSSNDEPWTFEILVPAGWTDWVEISEILSDSFEAIGVSATLQPVQADEYQNRGQGGDFDLTLGMTESRRTAYGMYRSMMSPSTVRPVGEQSIANWHRFGDEEADAFLLAYEMTSEAHVQEELLHQVQIRFAELAPAIPLLLGPSWGVANSRRVRGFPSEENAYARLSPNTEPDSLLVLTRLQPRE